MKSLMSLAVTVADYISRAESESRQRNPRDQRKNKKDMVTLFMHFFFYASL